MALTLNVSAISVFVRAAAHSSPHVTAEAPSRITTRLVAAAEHATPARVPDSAPATATPATAPPVAVRTHDDVTAAAHQDPPAADAATTSPYYEFGEVDTPALPDTDWNLDPDLLDALGVSRMVFEVFISETGEVVDCHVIEPEALDPDARQTLEARLRQTTLQPALRGGRSVASLRKIELSLAPAELPEVR